jgi:hypothetical protein
MLPDFAADATPADASIAANFIIAPKSPAGLNAAVTHPAPMPAPHRKKAGAVESGLRGSSQPVTARDRCFVRGLFSGRVHEVDVLWAEFGRCQQRDAQGQPPN